jgi:tripartite-type tricarboxylate transporter receptor subunit TctC
VNLKAIKPDWVRDHKIKVIVQDLPTRSKDLPDVPALGELGDTPEAKQLLGLYAGMGAIGRSIFAPPGVPKETVEQLRAGFAAMASDPEFIVEAKRLGGELDMASGRELQNSVQKTLDVSASTIERAKSIFASQ